MPPGSRGGSASNSPGKKCLILAPLVRKRKGHHREVVERAAKQGFERVRIDGKLYDSARPPRIDRYQVHDVEAVVARRKIHPGGKMTFARPWRDLWRPAGGR